VSGVYQKNVYSETGDTPGMLNIKRLSVSVSALSSNENWYIVLKFDNAEDYKITVEVQRNFQIPTLTIALFFMQINQFL